MARAAEDGARITLLNDELKVRDRHSRATVTRLADAEAVRAALAERFGLLFPPGTRFGPPGAA